MKQIVLISRKWNNPKISMLVTDEELSFAISLDDFVVAMKREMESDSGDIDTAVAKVVKGIKGESPRVMG